MVLFNYMILLQYHSYLGVLYWKNVISGVSRMHSKHNFDISRSGQLFGLLARVPNKTSESPGELFSIDGILIKNFFLKNSPKGILLTDEGSGAPELQSC